MRRNYNMSKRYIVNEDTYWNTIIEYVDRENHRTLGRCILLKDAELICNALNMCDNLRVKRPFVSRTVKLR